MKKILVFLNVMIFYDREILKGIKSAIQISEEDYIIDVADINDYLDYKISEYSYIIIDGDKLKHDVELIDSNLFGIVYSSHHLNIMSKGYSSLVLDNKHFSKVSLSKFIELGLNKVCFYANKCDSKYLWNNERYQGFLDVANLYNLEVVNIDEVEKNKLSETVGVLCTSDRSARTLINNLQKRNITIPNDVCIIGIDCDLIENELSPISISSIEISPYDIGKKIFSLLNSNKNPHKYYYKAAHFCEKESCNIELCSDIVIGKAINYIHKNYMKNIKVSDVAKSCFVSRKTLDVKFNQAMNKSVHTYISELRLTRCKYLLKETNDAIDSIAMQCGYPNVSYLYQVFKKKEHCTPLSYRKE